MIRTLTGDCRSILPTLDAGSVQCVVTSPPYYGLRDYGTAQWEGGDAACDHIIGEYGATGRGMAVLSEQYRGGGKKVSEPKPMTAKHECPRCGARRIDAQLGLESTPEAYLQQMVAVFREVRRVLRDDGTVWCNMGDSYASNGNHSNNNGTGASTLKADGRAEDSRLHSLSLTKTIGMELPAVSHGLASKQLLMMPARLALALQADGWWLRSAIVWSKPNPMPESVDSRPTSAYEMVYLLAKGQWKSRVVKFADLPSERVHLLEDFGLSPAIAFEPRTPSRGNHHRITQDCVRLAAAIFDRAQRENEFSLPPFYSEVWQQGSSDLDGHLVRALPEEHRAAAICARFLAAQTTTKEFVAELNGWHVALPESGDFLIGRAASVGLDAPAFYRDGKGTIAIHHAGKICEIDFVHGEVITKSPTKCNYYYDADAVREPGSLDSHGGGRIDKPHPYALGAGRNDFGSKSLQCPQPAGEAGRSCRNVWTIATSPFSDAHFATFPPALVERCIRAGTSERGCCAACGKPWQRTVERTAASVLSPGSDYGNGAGRNDGGRSQLVGAGTTTTGWSAGCKCEADTKPCVVLDPFAGAGTTMLVADRLQRDAIGIELNPAHVGMATERIVDDAPLFSSWPPAEDPADARMAHDAEQRDLFAMAAD